MESTTPKYEIKIGEYDSELFVIIGDVADFEIYLPKGFMEKLEEVMVMGKLLGYRINKGFNLERGTQYYIDFVKRVGDDDHQMVYLSLYCVANKEYKDWDHCFERAIVEAPGRGLDEFIFLSSDEDLIENIFKKVLELL